MKLQIREVRIPWYLEGERGQLLVANPGAKPEKISDDDWTAELLQSALSQGIKHVVVPQSVLPFRAAMTKNIEGTADCRLYFLKDTFAFNVENLSGDSPLECIRVIFEHLKNREDVLIVSVSEKIPGFLPATLSVLADSMVHVEKVIYPVQHEGYVLTQDQIAYIYGLSDAVSYTPQTVDM